MAGVDRVTVTLPNDLVKDIDRREKNRSKFVAEAVRNELDRRRREELRRSLHNPHPESAVLPEQGLEEWARGLPEEDSEALVDKLASRFGGWPCIVVSDPDVQSILARMAKWKSWLNVFLDSRSYRIVLARPTT